MRVALIGFTGQAGSRVLDELLRRGHAVTSIARRAAAAAPPGMTVRAADARNPAQLAPVLAGHDAVISATKFVSSDPHALLDAVRRAGVTRLLVVGGAGSLEVAPGRMLLDSPGFPDAYKPEATAGRDFLDVLRAQRNLGWTFLSPSAELAPGARTGNYRLGDDRLLVDADGKSWISMEDLAIALVDELEAPKHSGRRFTAGY